VTLRSPEHGLCCAKGLGAVGGRGTQRLGNRVSGVLSRDHWPGLGGCEVWVGLEDRGAL
jgi:hypothetical protein